MLTQYVGLISETDQVTPAELMRVAAALQKQAIRDFAPLWDANAVVSAFATLDDLPLGYWPILVQDDINFEGAAGIHLDKDGQPFALVQHSNKWSLTASHELLEMLADPFGNRVVAGDGIAAYEKKVKRDARVEYLVEVSDPSEDEKFAYTVNGELVSDFYTPRYFDPVASAGVQYSFTGAITEPRQILRGGYLSWHDPMDDHWFIGQFFSGTEPTIRDLGVFDAQVKSLRSEVDRLGFRPKMMGSLPKASAVLAMATKKQSTASDVKSAKGNMLRTQIDAMVSAARAQATASKKGNK